MEVKDQQSLPQDEAIVFPTPHPSLLQDNLYHCEEAFLITPSPNNNNIVHNEHANNVNKNKNDVFGKNENDYLKSFPPGYRFCPHDDELVVQYLKKKVMNEPLPPNNIMDVDLYLHNPEQLTEKYQGQGEKEWYFFTPRNRKYRNGSRPNRAAGGGYWKATGADRPVKHEGVLVGLRKALVFYEGKPPNGGKTSWIMHEYRVDEPPRSKRNANDMKLDEWVLCRVYKKADNKCVKVQKQDEEKGNSNPLVADEEEDTLVLPQHENDMEQEYDLNIGDSDELLINPHGRDYIQSCFLHSNEAPFVHASPSPLKFDKFNNNLMPAGAALPFTYATGNVYLPRGGGGANVWSTNYLPRGGGGANVWSTISNYSYPLGEVINPVFFQR